MFTPNEALALARAGINRAFEQLLSNPATTVDPLLELAQVVPSRRLTETYNLELLSIYFRRWRGARRFLNASEVYFQITNEPFESSFAVDRDVADDNDFNEKLTSLRPKFLAAFEAKKADLVADLLLNGTTQKCYDKQYMFDTDHPVDDPQSSGSLSNYFANTPLTRANLVAVDTAMRTRPAATGSNDLRVVNPRVLVIAPGLQDQADLLLNTTEIVDANGNRIRNTMYQRYRPIVSPRLWTQPTAWYLWDPDYKPTIVQVRKEVEVIVRDDPKQDNMFHHRQKEVGADGRMGAGYGPWQGIAKAVGS